MSDKVVSLDEGPQDLAALVRQVAQEQERIILATHGAPQAVLVSVADYARLQDQDATRPTPDHDAWQTWTQRADALSRQILAERGGRPLDLDALLQADKDDRDARHDDLIGS